MAHTDLLESLLSPESYSHACSNIRVVETHISWVFLTGQFAYKLKKPIDLGFLDFSTLAKRRFYCLEELRCNALFAPEIYLELARIHRDTNGRYTVDGTGEVVEYAVKMRQFDDAEQLDHILENDELDVDLLRDFAAELARIYEKSRRVDTLNRGADAVLAPLLANFHALSATPETRRFTESIAGIRAWSLNAHKRLKNLFAQRARHGWIRECHGDLHLSNLVRTNSGIRAFDCIEFNSELREIDTISDVAFLFMDCAVRDRTDVAYSFIDGYLDATADYTGARLLRFYAVYRSMVRAKVAALQLAQSFDRRAVQKVERHIDWAQAITSARLGRCYLMCGVSGSGKSYLAARLVAPLAALRLRSDRLRRAIANSAYELSSGPALDGGLYSDTMKTQVYDALLDLSRELISAGENVIIDATFLAPAERQKFYQLARELHCRYLLILCEAPHEILKQRITKRQLTNDDPSAATLAVLERQLAAFELPRDEARVCIRTDKEQDLRSIVAKINATAAKV